MSSSGNNANKAFTRDTLFDLKGHVALVTGGGSGIGLMVTQSLVANGAKVYITGRTQEKLDRVVEKYSEGKDTIIPITADVTSKDEIAKLVKEIESREDHLCILVNNAGISGATLQTEASSAQEMKKNLFEADASTFDDWISVYQTNVAPLFFATTAFLPLLQKSTEKHPKWSGTVLNITSISGLVKNSQHHFQYNASKAAANHLTRMLATEIANNSVKVRVNAIAPGVFPSEMTANESGEDQKSYIPKEKYEDKVPAGRPGKDEDMAQAVLSVVVNQYVTGQIMVIDGGYTVAAGQ
ncbi:NAD(P)-binding protein [Xylariaceae sp. FL1019]|nr:NAD(P)-binding protein [Xylariaceae sp. FL1019]